MHKMRNRIFTLLMAVMVFGLFATITPSASAAPTPDVSIDVGNPGVGGMGYTVAGNVITLDGSGGASVYRLYGTTTTNCVRATANVTVILDGVSITPPSNGGDGVYALAVDAQTVTVWLESTGTLGGAAETGLRVNSGNLTIDGPGSLDAFGYTGAAIGGGWKQHFSGNITIAGGTVNATSNANGAAIGGGLGFFSAFTGTVNITGGMVTAIAGSGAGIGSGENSNFTASGVINISGGTVNANGTWGAAIGCGALLKCAGNIIISGGTVNANSTMGAAIGTSHGGNFDPTAKISISGGTITASGSSTHGGVGGGTVGNCTATITGGSLDADLTKANSVSPTDGISPVYAVEIMITDGGTPLADVALTSGSYTAQSAASGKIFAYLPAGSQSAAFSKAGYSAQNEIFTVVNPGPTLLNVIMTQIVPPTIPTPKPSSNPAPTLKPSPQPGLEMADQASAGVQSLPAIGVYSFSAAPPTVKDVKAEALAGRKIKLTVTANSASGGNLLYQWQVQNEDGSWKNIGGANGSVYTVRKLKAGKSYSFRCMVKSGGTMAYSDAVKATAVK